MEVVKLQNGPIQCKVRSAPRKRSGVKVPALLSIDDERGQNSAAISAGVDADPVRTLLDFVADGVAVDDDAAVITVVEQERLADPTQVRLELLLDRNPGP